MAYYERQKRLPSLESQLDRVDDVAKGRTQTVSQQRTLLEMFAQQHGLKMLKAGQSYRMVKKEARGRK